MQISYHRELLERTNVLVDIRRFSCYQRRNKKKLTDVVVIRTVDKSYFQVVTVLSLTIIV
jgi:hypothetical protein